MSSRAWNIVNFILAFIAIVLVIIIYVVVFEHRNDFLNNGIPVVIQDGKISATDNMITGGNNLYLAKNKQPLTLTLTENTKNTVGKTIQINASALADITLATSTSEKIIGNTTTPTKILKGTLVTLVVTSKGVWTRLD